jgi:trk system potassium uptake protein TrkH
VLGIHDAFGVVAVLWIAICFFGAIPLYCSGVFSSFADALFESVSGFTTTGASVVGDVESLPRSVNVWRCLTHWLGGMGVVALAVAMIPLLGAGGFRLIKAETTGPDKGKFTASIASTAKILWFIYVGMTAVQALWLWNLGLDWIDALCHSFSTLATGGYSTRNGSVGSFGIAEVEWVCIIFMLLSSVNFVLYCKLFTGRFSEVAKNSELRAFLMIVPLAITLVVLVELSTPVEFGKTLRDACFQVASVISSTGFMTRDYTQYLGASQIVIVVLFFLGGCAGSTAGGIKIIRWTMLSKQFINELRRLVHPYGVFTLRIDGVSGREALIPAVASFVFVYFLLVLLTAFFGGLSGLDPFTAFTAALSMVGNIGPAFGSLGPSCTYGDIPAILKCWYMVAMLAGRLEIYTILLLVGSFVSSKGGTKNAYK